MTLSIAMATHVGRVRQNNEDAHMAVPVKGMTGAHLAVLCDGVGGAASGEVASALACTRLQSLAEEGKLALAADLSMRSTLLDMCARRAHNDIAEMSMAQREHRGMACTLVAALADATHVGWVAVGDSRLYHYHDGRLEQISEDQTVAQALVHAGRLAPQDMATHPDRNTLQYCLGVERIDAPLQPQTGVLQWQPGDRLLLCSDGLTDMVSDTVIEHIMQASQGDACVEQLVAAALEAGGRDNITVILLSHQEDSL